MDVGHDLPPVVLLTRKERFSAAHRLHSPQLSSEENALTFGQCNNPNGHGHNYEVLVTVKAPVNHVTGMAMNLADLKAHMQKVIATVDHRHLDKDVPYFKTVTSTTENLAVYIWRELKQLLPDPKCLFEVVVHETDKNSVTYRGETVDTALEESM